MSSDDKSEESQDDYREEVDYLDEQDYRARRSYEIGTRRTPLPNNLLFMLGDLLQPQTQGFNHINMDMTFTYLDRFDIMECRNSSFIITMSEMLGLRGSAYLSKSSLATLLNLKRSQNGKGMSLFNETVTKTSQELEDKTAQKTGFKSLFKKKNKGE
jgi:hypothetical protein